MKNAYSFQRLALRRNKSFLKFFGLLAVMLFAGSSVAWGQYLITGSGSANTYTQNFDNFRGTAATLPINWTVTTASYNTTYPVITSGATTPSVSQASGNNCYAGRASSSSDDYSILQKQASSGSTTFTTFTFSAKNSTGGSLSGFVVTWNVEQFNSAARATTVELKYRIDAGSYVTTGITGTNKFTATTGTSTTFSVVQTSRSITITGLNIASNSTVDFQFSITNGASSGSNAHIGIDDFTVYANAAAATAPTVTTQAASVLATTSATFNGTITSDGGAAITDRGFCYNTTGSVTISDNKTSEGGTATGAFSKSFGSLSVNTQYFYRAYATNSVNTTLSSSDVNFYTLANVPTAPTVNNATTSSLDVAIGGSDGNPSSTTYAIHETSSNKFVQADGTLGASSVWQTSAVWGTKTVTGLTASTSYTFEVKAKNGADTETAYSNTTSLSTTVAPQIDWCNLQWPASGSIVLGDGFLVYAQVYKLGVTEVAEAGAGIQAWIGYSTSNTDPSTWTNWVPATFNSQSGNNDEWKADVGAALTTSGTYYYASRFQLGSAPYVYGGTAGFWASGQSGKLTVSKPIGWANLQSPASGAINTGGNFNVYAQVYKSGVTDASGQGADITVWIGYNTSNTDPSTWTNWVATTYNTDAGNNDEYVANIGTGLAAGTYYYASRIRYKTFTSDYVYGGYSTSNGGFWDGTTNVSGTLTVTTPEPADHVTNFAAATTAPTHSSIHLTWTDAVGASHYLIKGSAVSYEDITTPVDLSSEVDGTLVKNVAAGAGTYTFEGLTGETAYFFKIFPYNGTGAAVNFKTDGTVPQASATTAKTPTLLLVEDFDYANGALLTANGWMAHSGAGTQAIDVAVPGLSFNGYVGSGIGGAAKVDNTGEDLNKAFSAQTSGSIYAAFVISASATNAAGYFFHLANDNIANTTFVSRVWINGTGTSVGIGTTASVPISVNTPTLLVVKYNIDTKLSSLYVLNSMSATEPATADATYQETLTLTNIGAVCLRQYDASQNIIVDGIRVTTSWADLPVSFTGTGEWTDAARWNTGTVPGITAQVVVDGAATINSDVEVAGLTINAGKSLTVNAAKQLTISGAATNNGTITIQSDENGTGAVVGDVSGAATVNQYLPGYRTWYLSSPVSNVAPSNMDRYKFYDETTGNWSTTAPAQTIGAGFLAVPTNNTVTSTSFSGTLNNGNININVTRSVSNGSKPGFNLVGNPYPSYLDWSEVNDANSSLMPTSTMWYRTKKQNQSGELVYQFWTVNGNGVGSPSGASQYIPPMQAFWVRAKASGQLQLTNDMRSHAVGEDYLLKAPAANSRTLIRLELSNGTNTDETVLYLSDNANNGLDAFDAPKMSNEDATIAEIFTRAGNEKLVINALQTLPKDTEIALGFEAGSATSFTLRANELSNLPTDVKLILKDNVTKAETDLTDGTAVYSFSNIATSGDRFSIIFRTKGAVTGIDQPTFSGLSAYSNANNQLTVLYDGAIDAQTVVSVYNAVGQRLVTQSLKGVSTVIDGEFAPGVYVVKVNNLSRKLTIKK